MPVRADDEVGDADDGAPHRNVPARARALERQHDRACVSAGRSVLRPRGLPSDPAVTGDAESYQYLVESIRKFPRPNAFAEMIGAAGFSRVKWQSLSGGIVALHSGWRL